MQLIVGLGNPEEKYIGTRHNIGFYFIDKIKEGFSAQGGPATGWEFNKKFNAEISKGKINEKEVLLVKPMTFMNLSGEAIREILSFYKLSPKDVLVIHDDLDIIIGKYKVTEDSRSAGHNGVQNIIDNLGTQEFKRIRIGVGEEKNGVLSCRLDAHDFVLGKFSEEEWKKIQSLEKNVLEEIKNLV